MPDFSGPLHELRIAYSALRDKMWDSAEKHASAAAEVESDPVKRRRARFVVLEALAGKGRAAEILERLDAWKDDVCEGYRYWRAWALEALNRPDEALAALSVPFAEEAYRLPALRLAARLAARGAEGSSARRETAEKAFAAVAAAAGTNQAARTENAVEWARFRAACGDLAGAAAAVRAEKAVDSPGRFGDEAQLFVAEAGAAAGQREAAVRIWRRLIEPTTAPAVRRRAGFALGFDEMTRAETRRMGAQRVRDLVKESPGRTDSRAAQLALADALLTAGCAGEAEVEYRKFLEMYPEVADAHVLEGRAWALLRLGRRTEAAAAFSRAAAAAVNPEDRARCIFKRGDVLVEDGRFAEAAELFLRLAGTAGADAPRAHFRAADAYERAGGHAADAAEIYRNLARGTDAYALEASLRLAAAARAAGRAEEAAAAYGRVAGDERAPRNLRARALMGRGRLRHGEYDFRAAEADYAAAAAMDPVCAGEAAFLSALSLYGEGRDDEARAAAAQLAATTREAALRNDVTLWLARFDFNHGAYADAQTGFLAAATNAASAAVRADAYLCAARTAAAQADYPRAVEFARLCRKNLPPADPLAVEALVVQGEALLEQARFGESVYVFDRAIASAPAEESARRAGLLRADALFALGADNDTRYREALEAYRAAAARAPNASERLAVEFKIGRTLEKLRRFDEAADQYYANVVQAYGAARVKGVPFDETARAFFARAAFALADFHETNGRHVQARQVLKLVVKAGVPAAEEASRRLARLRDTGG